MPPIQSPIRLAGNPPEVIDSTEAAARFMERRDGDALDIEAANLLRLLRDANTAESADEAILDSSLKNVKQDDFNNECVRLQRANR